MRWTWSYAPRTYETMNRNLIGQDELCGLLGCKRPGDAARLLEKQGIKPIRGRPGFWFVTLDQLNAAGGITKASNDDDETALF